MLARKSGLNGRLRSTGLLADDRWIDSRTFGALSAGTSLLTWVLSGRVSA